MGDLRTGLVEAIAKAMYEGITGLDDWEDEATYAPEHAEATRTHAAFVLDAALGFLTDNWPKTGDDIEEALMLRVGRSSDRTIETCITTFLAALSDNRDTGEKP